jgi:hypothetical protein
VFDAWEGDPAIGGTFKRLSLKVTVVRLEAQCPSLRIVSAARIQY